MDEVFEGFPYMACNISAYIFVINVFIIELKDGNLTWYDPPDKDEFVCWLTHHQIAKIE